MNKNRSQIVAACVVGAAGVAGAIGMAKEITATPGGLPMPTRPAAPVTPPVAPSPFPAATRALISRLQNIKYFAIGGTGIAGRASDGETAMCALLRDARAPEAFEELARSAKPEGRLYALLALKRIAPARFGEIYPAFATETTDAKTLRGCIGEAEPVKAVALEIKRGVYDAVTATLLAPATQKLVRRLQQAAYFSVGAVGPPAPPDKMRGWGPIGDGERDLRRLLLQSDAVPALETLTRTGNRQGGLYGLLGLRRVAPPAQYRERYAAFAPGDAPAHVLQGCLVTDQPARAVADEINRGVWDDYLKRATVSSGSR